MKNKSSVFAVLALLAGIMIFSTVEISGKVIAQHGTIEPFTMVFVRFFFTGIVLLAVSLPIYLRKKALTLRDLGVFTLNGFIGIAASLVLFHAAIGMFEKASSSAVVFCGNGLFTVILARFINKEKLSVRKILAVCVGMLGISLFIFEKGTPSWSSLKAILVMLSAAMLFAISVCITRLTVQKYGAMLYMGASSMIGAIFTLPLALYFMPANCIGEIQKAWLPLCYMVFFATALAYWLYYIGLKGVTAFTASMAFFLKPGLACIFAWLYLGNTMNAWTITGTVLLVLAMCMTVKKAPKATK